MSDFANLSDAGRRLAAVLGPAVALLPDPVLVPILPNGVPVVAGIVPVLALPVVPLAATRSDEGVDIGVCEELAGRTAVVVDDGVETGTAARAAALAARASDVATLVLAVPVCPHEALAELRHLYDDVVAVVTPFARRRLGWHYADFDTVDDATARRMLASLST